MTRLLQALLVVQGIFVGTPLLAAVPNIVLIVADDLGYGDLGCYGASAIPTPNIDRLAKEGIRFTRCYATAATCTPSRYSLLTGEYAWRQTERKTSILDGDAPLAISLDRTTLPEVLQRAGYRTALIGKWHLGIGDGLSPVDFNGHIAPGPLEVGFDEAFYIPATVDRVPCVFIENHAVDNLDSSDPLAINYQSPFPGELTGKEHPELLKYPADAQHSGSIVNGISRIGYMSGGAQARWNDEAITDTLAVRTRDFIKRNRERPFFLLLGAHDPHVPHAPHPRFLGKSKAGIRGDSIVQFDWLVGHLRESIQDAGLDNQTLIIVTSDNGPTVFDGYFDGSIEAAGQHKAAERLRGAKYTVYEGGCRVPFVIRWPDGARPGTSGAMFSLMDLLPSLAALAGVDKLPDAIARDAIELSDMLTDPRTASRRDSLVLEGAFNSRALVGKTWKYIPSNHDALPNGVGRGANAKDERLSQARIPNDLVFNLESDPGEARNLADECEERTESLRNELGTILGQP